MLQKIVSKLSFPVFTFLFIQVFCLTGTAADGAAGTKSYDVKIETVDGVKSITSPGYPRYGKAKLKVRDELTIGAGEEEDVLVYMPLDVQADSSGNIYTWEYRLCCIKVFNRHGRFLLQIGRRGQGPGEFSQSTMFTLMEDSKIFLLDADKRRISIFTAEGNLIRDFRYDKQWFCSGLQSVDKHRIYISKTATLKQEGMKSEYQLFEKDKQLYRYNPVNNKWTPLITLTGESYILRGVRVGEKTGAEGMNLPFLNEWNVNSQRRPATAAERPNQKISSPMENPENITKFSHIIAHGDIVTGFSKTYRLSVFSPQGQLKFKFGREFTLKKNKKLAGIKKILPKFVKTLKYLPVFRKLLFDESGRIWVELFKTEDRYVNVKYDIFSHEGIYIKQVTAPYRIYRFANNKIYGISETEDGERVIKRAAIISGPE